ncbi:uncharacterized protein Z519_01173 [Cladophialophora bantiana CBS 173.52]|uniref:Uncharacterized protein n=1 Tax=Cladophialophora bantiana (strain ATCC 10958 / CBS 173.52 / CDC B-1940 / NIH 8579) TaxID=1442370 RepID=A0A0D2ILD0_CLAB1|nr:uncharacterized protein Z519_01173 [Cladophialophora bantiana CBS 173.52]KIW97589.1 hypothetical protein Z519_01173 [Cladophialophora bantiana CBS 173.52]
MFEFCSNLDSVQTVLVNARDFLARLKSALSLSMHVAELAPPPTDRLGNSISSDLAGERPPQGGNCHAFLWALCVGSWAEKRHNPHSSLDNGDCDAGASFSGNVNGGVNRHHDDSWWFKKNLPLQARKMGVKDCLDVESILHGFYHVDKYMPGLDGWVTELLRACW